MLVENVQRKDLGPIEKAEALGSLRKQRLSQSEIARRVGMHVSSVNYLLNLLVLSDADREKVRTGQISSTHAVRVVTEHRQTQRKVKGTKSMGRPAVVEAPWLTGSHKLRKRSAAPATTPVARRSAVWAAASAGRPSYAPTRSQNRRSTSLRRPREEHQADQTRPASGTGGRPLEGRWYYATNWAWLMGNALTYPPWHPARQPSEYTPTGGMVDHPYDPAMPQAHGWRWVGR